MIRASLVMLPNPPTAPKPVITLPLHNSSQWRRVGEPGR